MSLCAKMIPRYSHYHSYWIGDVHLAHSHKTEQNKFLAIFDPLLSQTIIIMYIPLIINH